MSSEMSDLDLVCIGTNFEATKEQEIIAEDSTISPNYKELIEQFTKEITPAIKKFAQQRLNALESGDRRKFCLYYIDCSINWSVSIVGCPSRH